MTGHDPQPDEDDDLRPLADVFRRHPAPEPSAQAWADALDRIEAGLPARPRRWPWVAAAVLALGLGYALWPGPKADDEPFPVASASEVHVIDVSVEDADRLALGLALLGTFEVATVDEIEVLDVEPDPDDGRTPVMQPNAAVPLIVASAGDP